MVIATFEAQYRSDGRLGRTGIQSRFDGGVSAFGEKLGLAEKDRLLVKIVTKGIMLHEIGFG